MNLIHASLRLVRVLGNLVKCYLEWERIGASGFVLSVIRNGYKIPFIDFSIPQGLPKLCFSPEEKDFVSRAISDLIVNRCVEVLDFPPAIANPLSVSIQSSGKKRSMLDLYICWSILICIFSNKKLSVKIFKWLARFCLRFYLFKFDLKSGYHHVDIFPDHRRFLAFSWDFGNGVLKYFNLQYYLLVCHPLPICLLNSYVL